MRRKRSQRVMREIGSRLCEALNEELHLSDGAASRLLGYSSRSMLSNVRAGRTLPDVTRLWMLSELRTRPGKQVDLHWILTGEGARLRNPVEAPTLRELRARVVQALEHTDATRIQAALELIGKGQ